MAKFSVWVVSHSRNPGAFLTEAEARAFCAKSAPGEMVVTRHDLALAPSSDPEYLARFPEHARPYADRAYQDGYEDAKKEDEEVEALTPEQQYSDPASIIADAAEIFSSVGDDIALYLGEPDEPDEVFADLVKRVQLAAQQGGA